MNNILLKRFIYMNYILGFIFFIFFISYIAISGLNIHLILHLSIGALQLILFGNTFLCFRHLLKEIHDEHNKVIDEYEKLDILKDMIINRTPTGLIFLDSEGTIQYANPAIGNILGSTETVGLNVFKLDTIQQQRKLYEGLMNASKGVYTEILGMDYTCYTSRTQKLWNVYISPIIDKKSTCTTNTIIFIHDITKEHNLKLELENTYVSTIKLLAELIDARDKYTGEHSENVSKYVSILCNGLNLDEKTKSQIEIAASIHDIGKIGVADSILNKPDILTDEEYESIKKHPVIGAEVLNKINEFRNISKIVRHHHERWDGTGYPSCLKGEEIPLGSQIISISDTYDAITTDRVYRKSLSKEKAIQILLKEKGKQFNPELVDIFIKNIMCGAKF